MERFMTLEEEREKHWKRKKNPKKSNKLQLG